MLKSNESLLTQQDYGSTNGMYLSMEISSASANETPELYFYVQDNNQLTPFRILSSYTFQTGFKTSIGLKKTIHNRLGRPYNDCYEKLNSVDSYDSDLFRLTLNNTFDYRRLNCYELCAAVELSIECNCSTPGLYIISKYTAFCGKGDCTKNFFRKFNYQDSCQKKCPLECDTVSFDYYHQESVYKATQLDKDLFKKNNPTRILNESTSLALEVFFQELKFDQVEESENITLIQFIANFGGTLGLFLGLSFLSFTEGFDIFLIILSILKSKNSN